MVGIRATAKRLLARLATRLKGVGFTSDRCSHVVPCRGLALGTGADGASLVEREVGAREGVVLASSGKLGQLQIQIRIEILYCCRVAVFFAGGFFSFLSPISSNPTYTM